MSGMSTGGTKSKPTRSRPRKSLSSSSTARASAEDPALTSFPSLSPGNTPESKGDGPKSTENRKPSRTVSQRARERKATLAGLTNASPSLRGRALFDESPRSSLDVPGALHLANDDHIDRLVARVGPVKLIRQFANDLAQRDAEISALRVRADERERALKKMLREAQISHFDIEKRLFEVENPRNVPDHNNSEVPTGSGTARKVTGSIDKMVHEAMQDDLNIENGALATALADANRLGNGGSDSQSSSPRFGANRKRTSSVKSWQDYFWGSNATSRKTSRANSIISEDDDEMDATARPRVPSNVARRKGLDNLFSPSAQAQSTSYFIGGTRKPSRKSSAQDVAGDNVPKNKKSTSITSWTKLFAGNPSAGKDATEQNTMRGRANSSAQGPRDDSRAGSVASGKAASAFAALTKVSSASASRSTQSIPSTNPAKSNPATVRRTLPGSNVPTGGPEAVRSETASVNLGPVEMETILPTESKPPTMRHTYSTYESNGVLTDRFGFIYDQRQRKRQREAAMAVTESKRKSFVESLNSIRNDSETNDDAGTLKTKKDNANSSVSSRPATPMSTENAIEPAPTRRWQDYLRVATRPTELLSHTPSAGAIVTLTIADVPPPAESEGRSRGGSISVDSKRGSVPSASVTPEPVTTDTIADSPEFAGSISNAAESQETRITNADQEPVKLLLDQLTELHDSLQAEKTIKWNEFLRKVRAERGAAAAAASDNKSNQEMPEASLIDGEVIGITNLGLKGKLGRAKWKEFKSLVLAGIPVAYRAKIWSECSGAAVMRIPGYYEDLVAESNKTTFDPEITSQINADIRRTLTDNVFFRHGPGVSKLKEVLLAYAKRNSSVGYCQGMNLITASLLLIMPTPEDAFWILVAMIENILPAHYYDHGLVGSRADQAVLREYVGEILPKLGNWLEELGVELEALTFQWFLSVFTDCLSAEALYRVWDVVLCLNSSSAVGPGPSSTNLNANNLNGKSETPTSANFPSDLLVAEEPNPGTGSTFLFQLALALLKLNEEQLLTCDSPAAVYGYINHNMTNHAISIDGLIQASEELRNVIKREDVLAKRKRAVQDMT
ncbi:MAG: hypothetical protein Q9227_005265 [Pyrenula ochraceoflavens]